MVHILQDHPCIQGLPAETRHLEEANWKMQNEGWRNYHLNMNSNLGFESVSMLYDSSPVEASIPGQKSSTFCFSILTAG